MLDLAKEPECALSIVDPWDLCDMCSCKGIVDFKTFVDTSVLCDAARDSCHTASVPKGLLH